MTRSVLEPSEITGDATAHVSAAVSRELWQNIWDADPHALASQRPEWFDMMCDLGRFQLENLLFDFGHRRILLLLAHRTGLSGALSRGSWPAGSGFGGVLTEGGSPTVDEARAIFACLASGRSIRTYLSPPPGETDLWAAAAPPGAAVARALTQRVDLTGGYETVWKERFSRRVRSLSRRAEAAGVEVEVDTTGRLVPVFETLYEASLERWANRDGLSLFLTRRRFRRFDPPGKFAAVARHLGDRCVVRVAWLRGEAAAATIELRHADTGSAWRSVMNKELNREVPANVLLSTVAIQEACTLGYRWYDLGDSEPGSSIATFKKSFGAEDLWIQRYWLEKLPVSRLNQLAGQAVKRVLALRLPSRSQRKTVSHD